MRLATLLHDIARVPPEADRALGGLAVDSRRLRRGDGFCALAGRTRHGLDFLEPALAAGAAAVLVDAADPRCDAALRREVVRRGAALAPVPDLARQLGRLAARLHDHPSAAFTRICAVTGTDGKTSVSHFLAALADRPGSAAVFGTLGRGRPGSLGSPDLTTPDAVSVQAGLAELARAGFRELAVEASSHGLDQYRLDGMRIDVAILTQLGRDHLDYHGDVTAYARAKARLFDWPGLAGVALNLDDAFGRDLATRIRPAIRQVGYGGADAPEAVDGTLRADQVVGRLAGLGFRLRWRDREETVELPLLGRFNVANIAAAVAGMLAAGVAFDDLLRRLERVEPVPGRMERFGEPAGPAIVVDYAHTAGALDAALAALRLHARGRIVCVFGAGGDRDRGKRALMARVAAAGADRVILTDDNPRGEDPAAIVADLVEGLPRDCDCTVEHDRGEAIRLAWSETRRGDLVLVAGKGHETTQVRGEQVIEWSDRDFVRALVAGEGGDA